MVNHILLLNHQGIKVEIGSEKFWVTIAPDALEGVKETQVVPRQGHQVKQE